MSVTRRLRGPISVASSGPCDGDALLSGRIRRRVFAACLLLGAATLARAQELPPANVPATDSGTTTLAEVTVTGSRIRRTNDFNTPTPTTVIDAATLQNLGIVNVGETLTLTPANVSTFTPANTGNAPFFIGSYIPNLRGLNPYFGSRTLTLVNTERFVQTNQGDSVDLNFIPQILVSRIDVVTGGASAAYGSGAVAGVYNVILDNKLEGGKLDGDWSETIHGDGKDRHIGAAFGHGLFDNRVHFVVGGEYENQDLVGCYYARSYCHADPGAYQSNAGAPGVTTYGYGTDIRQNQFGSNGVFLLQSPPGPTNPYARATTTLQSTPGGVGTMPFRLGQQPLSTAPFSFNNVVPGGDGAPAQFYNVLMPKLTRGVLTGMASSEVNEHLNIKADIIWGRVQSKITGQNGNSIFQAIGPQNAFACPDSTSASATCANAGDASLAAAVGSGAFINKDWTSQEALPTTFTTDVTRFTLGFSGKIGQSSWTYDAYYEFGLTHHDQLLENNFHLNASIMALDSVINPATGKPACYVSVYGFNPNDPHEIAAGYSLADPRIAQGCVPLNPFGTQRLPASAVQYSFGNLLEQLTYKQSVVAGNLSGNYFSGIGAGPFSAAFGYEFRHEHGDNIDNPGVPDYISTDYGTQYGVSFGGQVQIHEGYLETNLPLAKDLPGVHLLELDVAARESRYDNKALYGIPVQGNSDVIHNLNTWKGSLIWEPLEGVRFRASQSRDARAANFRELYYAQIIHAGGVFGWCGPPGVFIDPCTQNLIGNVNLKPETSDTTTLGIVLTPSGMLSGLQFSADWFHIKVKDAIEQANPAFTQLGCRAGNSVDCNALVFGPTGVTAAGFPCDGRGGAAAYAGGCYNIVSASPSSYNGAFYEVRGIDFSVNYSHDLGAFGAINARLLTTWMDQQIFQSFPGGPVSDLLGQTGTGNNFLNDYTADAKWRGSLLVSWSKGPLSITPTVNFVSHGIMDYLGVTPAQGALYQKVISGDPSVASLGLHPLPYNYVPAYFLLNLNARYAFQGEALKGLQLFTEIHNVLNKQPPFTGGATALGPSSTYGGTNPIFFDTLGTSIRAGFTYTF